MLFEVAKERYIDTAFWDDKYIAQLSPFGKLLYLYFFTNPLTNVAGIYEITERRMEFDTGIKVDELQPLLKKFEDDKKIYYFDGWLVVCNMPKHQKWEERPKIAQGIKAILRKLPCTVLNHINTLSIPYTYPLNYIDLDLDSDLDSDSDTDIGKTAKRLIDYYHQSYNQKFGVKPVIKGAKDMTLIKKLLESFDEAQSKALFDAFFASDDKFIKESGYTIGVFFSQANKLALAAVKTAKRPDQNEKAFDEINRYLGGESYEQH